MLGRPGATSQTGPASPNVEERRDRPRRVNALLNAYYSIEGSVQKEMPRARVCSDLDRQGFDAKRYFDSMVVSGQLPDLVRRSKDLDAEVKELDCEMQKLVYENYTQFTRAAAVISRMKSCIETLDPDIKRLEGHISRMTEFEDRGEAGVAERSQQLEATLRRQRLCQKLEVLFGLPALLQRCLDRGAYGPAAEAHRCCSAFLSRYKHMPSFRDICQDVEQQIMLIKGALEQRLRSPELSVDDAVSSSETLLGLGEDQAKVLREYLEGRTAMLRRCLEHCFTADVAQSNGKLHAEATAATLGGVAPEPEGTAADASAEPPAEPSQHEQDLQRPESRALHCACARATGQYVPALCDAVEGLLRLLEGGATSGSTALDENALVDFVSARAGDLFGQMSRLVGQKCPPTRVLVDCVRAVCEALRRLHFRLSRLLPRLFMQFLNTVTNNAMETLFSDAASATLCELLRLHGTCIGVEAMGDACQSDVLEAIAKTEHSLIMNGFTALTDCQPLLSLLEGDQASGVQFVKRLHHQLMRFFLAFVEACHAYVGQDLQDVRAATPSLPALPRVAASELAEVGRLAWSGLYGLVLVRMGRHLEVKVISKVWSVAKDMFANSSAASELAPHPAVIRATRHAAQAVITHYTLVAGQRLAHGFRAAMGSRDWRTPGEPRGPCLLAAVVKDMHRWDAQLAQVLGDPRKERSLERRKKSRFKNAMELEMERLWAKKLQAFAAVPFNRNGVVVGILRISLKALYEFVREVTFAKFGLQQIQIDCAFLAAFVQEFTEAEDAGVLESLLNEVLTSASARCIEPVLMDSSIVEALCEERKREFRPE